MSHIHPVLDTDKLFTIDPLTRVIKSQSSKTTVVQYDHNSERLSFELPRMIEGHDMATCNKVEVHWFNAGTRKEEYAEGVYEVDDLSQEGEDKVVCSWLIAGESTQYAGQLTFLLRYCCLTGDVVDYAWNTVPYEKLYVSKGGNASATVVLNYSDILEKWKAELFAAGYINAETMQQDIKNLQTDMAVEKDRVDKLSTYVTPQMFGAKADGVTDDTAAIQAAAEYCVAEKVPLLFPGTKYLVSRTLDLRYIDLDIRGAVVVQHAGIGLLVGDKSSSAARRTIKIATVSHVAYADGDISVRIVGVMNAEVKIGNAQVIQLYADGDTEYSSIAYSDFYIGKCARLQITDNGDASGIGWINENTFHDCRVMDRFSIEGKTYTHNNNVFYKPCFEGADVVLSKCTRNKFYDARNEGEFTLNMDEDTSLNLVEYNFYYTFPFVSDSILGVTDNGVNNMVVNPNLRELDSVVVYSMNARTVAKNLYEIGTAKAKTSVEDDRVTIASAWASIIADAVIPVKDIRYLRAVSDAGAFRFSFTPLNANKEVMTNNPLTQDGNAAGANSSGVYNIQTDVWGALISIDDPNVAYIKLNVSTGSSASSFSFTNLSLLAYYHPRDVRQAVMLADYFKTAIPTN